MAAIYDYSTGQTMTEGLQGCYVCDEALIAAQHLADCKGEDVELVDDDGRWLVHPAGADGARESADFLGELPQPAGSWVISGSQGQKIRLIDIDEGAVAYDESGFSVDLDDLTERPEELADDGYGDRASRRILIWASEEDSQNDDGARAIASARWVV